MSKLKITVIDDSAEDIHLLLSILKDDYQINAAKSAKQAFELFKQQKPDVVLLDVNMPDMDGYEACKIIKEDPELNSIDVIFLSANDSTDEIIRGLELGALDYIVKPYDSELLLQKVRSATSRVKSTHQLKEQADQANQIVYTMLSESAGLSTTINYFRNCFSANDLNDLMKATLSAFNDINLNAALYFHIGNQRLAFTSNGDPTMLEQELLERFSAYEQPFFEQGERMFVVQEHLVLLIKNMPTDNEKRGSLKDHLMTLLEGCRAKLELFKKLNESSSKKLTQIYKAIDEAQSVLANLQSKQEEHKKVSLSILDEMVAEVEKSFFSMGLTDTQEHTLLTILSETGTRSLEHMESGLKLDEHIKQCVLNLSKAAADALR
ncbi:PleD family two-component system response regulator [Agaribacterium sp. ZY112]|uniref:response regulator n=1 Tax=Agaribacterium sp. ZY112 TaxID=3233574 RepID=UPI003523CD7A